MRARAAYISSFGTTTILVGAALLMLAVGSAIVGYRGWPGSVSGSSVESVPLARPAHDAGSLVRAAATTRLTRAKAPKAAAQAGRTVSTAGLVKLPRAASGAVVPGIVMVPARGTVGLVSPIGASYPAPSRPPIQTPPPKRRDNPGPPSTTPPLPVPDPGGTPLPGSPDQVAVIVGDTLASAPPVPGAPALPGTNTPPSVAAVLARLR
jgi:hypothetical protein